MAGVQTICLVIGLSALAMGLHELTHLIVARIASPFSVERRSRVPLRLRLDFERMPRKTTLRMITLASLFVGGVAAVIAIQLEIWQKIKTADPYYSRHLAIANWFLYTAPSPTDVRLAIWPPTEETHRLQRSPQ